MKRIREFFGVFRSRLGLKIVLPMLAIIVAFALPSFFFYRYQRIVDETTQDVGSHTRALSDLSQMEESLQKEMIASNQLVIDHAGGMTDHAMAVGSFMAAAGQVDSAHDRAAAFADSIQERAWFTECLLIHTRVKNIFLRQMVPLADTAGANISQLDGELDSLHQRMLGLRSNIAASFTADRDQAVQTRDKARQSAVAASWGAAAIAILLGLGLAGFAGRRLLKPVLDLSGAADAMSRGDLSQRVVMWGHDELSRLGNSFNFMAESLERRTKQLEEEKRRIRAIHQSIGDGIIVADRDGVIISVNPAAEAALGKPATELERSADTGVPALNEAIQREIVQDEMLACWQVKGCTKLDCPSYESADRRCWLQCGTFCHDQIQGSFKQKRDACERCDVFQQNAVRRLEVERNGRHFSVEIVPILNDEGREGGRTIVLNDITELRRANEELLRHSAELEELNKISENLAASLDLQETMRAALRQVLDMKKGDLATIHLLDRATGDMVMAAAEGIGDSLKKAVSRLPKGKGCPSYVVESGEAVIFDDMRLTDRVSPEIIEDGQLSYVGAPLKSKSRNIGTISLAARRVGAFSDEDSRLLTQIGLQVGVALEKAKLYQESVKNTKKAIARSNIAVTLASSLDIGDVYDDFVAETRKLVDFDRLSITVDAGKGRLRLLVQRGLGPPEWGDDHVFSADGTIPGSVVRSGKPFLSGDLSEGEELNGKKQLAADGFRSQLSVPMFAQGEVMGSMNLNSFKENAFGLQDIEDLRPIAGQVALALVNQHLFKDVSRAKKEWETTFDSVKEGIVIVDADNRTVRLNRAAAKIAGSPVNGLLGRKCTEVLGDLCADDSICPLKSSQPHSSSSRSETVTPDGRTLELALDPMVDSEGKTVGVVHILRDITESARLREQLLQSEKMVAVGQLVSGVAHEINNPLTGVIGYAQLLLTQDIGDKAKQDAEGIYREAERATRIVRHLLSFARKHQPERSRVDINAVIGEALELKAYDLKVNNIGVETDLCEDMPATTADPHQLQQVFLNLITNAEQAMMGENGAGLIKVSARFADGKIRISFADDGPGIPESIGSRIFDPFFTTKDVGKGTGLGLSVCFGVISEHGGQIWTQPTPGGGATMVVELPALEAEPAAPAAAKQNEQIRCRLGKILLVDDEAAVRDVLTKTLQQAGHTVETAQNGEVALGILKQKHFDCVVSDVKMPGMDGSMLHQAIMDFDPDLARHFIFISGDSVNPETRNYLSQVDNPSLTKPFDIEELQGVLQKVLAEEDR